MVPPASSSASATPSERRLDSGDSVLAYDTAPLCHLSSASSSSLIRFRPQQIDNLQTHAPALKSVPSAFVWFHDATSKVVRSFSRNLNGSSEVPPSRFLSGAG